MRLFIASAALLALAACDSRITGLVRTVETRDDTCSIRFSVSVRPVMYADHVKKGDPNFGRCTFLKAGERVSVLEEFDGSDVRVDWNNR